MLSDRDYMREDDSRPPWPASVVIMVVLVIAFALQCINDVYVESLVEGYLALTPAAILQGRVWQFLSFQFLHTGLTHLLFNVLGLWFFGRSVENMLGRNRFLIAYFASGILGGLLQVILMVTFPRHFAPFVFGASAGIMGVFAIFCRLESTSEIRWNFILPIRADVLLWITLGVSLFFTVVPSARGENAAHAAHLGGLLAGLGFVKLGWHHDYIPLPWEGLAARVRYFFRRRQPAPVLTPRFTGIDPIASVKPAKPVMSDADYIAREVDPILEKIAAHGIQSLTSREKKILEDARERVGKR